MHKPESNDKVKVIFRGSYVHIIHPDNFEILPEDTGDLWRTLSEACTAHKCKRVLSEGKLNLTKLRAWDAYNSGSQAGEIRGLRLACLFHGHVPDDKSEFFKTVAANRGAKIEFFSDKAAALKWLGVAETEKE